MEVLYVILLFEMWYTNLPIQHLGCWMVAPTFLLANLVKPQNAWLPPVTITQFWLLKGRYTPPTKLWKPF